jgi:hypothetical protein
MGCIGREFVEFAPGAGQVSASNYSAPEVKKAVMVQTVVAFKLHFPFAHP